MFAIKIEVAWWFDWKVIPPNELVPDGTEVRQSSTGALLRRELQNFPTVHRIALRREGIAEYMAGRVAAGQPKSLISSIVHHIEEAAQGNPPLDAWTSLTVEVAGDDALAAQLTAQLSAFYGLPKTAASPPGV